MKIDVSELLKQIGNTEDIETLEEASYPEDNLIIAKPVKVKLHLVNTGETILVTGTLEALVKLNCCRCLKEFELPLKVEVEEEYSERPFKPPARAKEVELPEEAFVFPIEADNTIDLSEAIRQNLLTALPLKPLCRKDCQGIEREKRKTEKRVDERWAKLKELKGPRPERGL